MHYLIKSLGIFVLIFLISYYQRYKDMAQKIRPFHHASTLSMQRKGLVQSLPHLDADLLSFKAC